MSSRSVEFTLGGEDHKVFEVNGHAVVDHPDSKGGVYDLGEKSLSEGVKAVKDWHKNNG